MNNEFRFSFKHHDGGTSSATEEQVIAFLREYNLEYVPSVIGEALWDRYNPQVRVVLTQESADRLMALADHSGFNPVLGNMVIHEPYRYRPDGISFSRLGACHTANVQRGHCMD